MDKKDLRKSLYYQKAKLNVYKENYKNYFKTNSLIKKFIIELDSVDFPDNETIYAIDQNPNSILLLLESTFAPNVQTYFFMIIFNLYQDLLITDLKNSQPYYSYSQSFITYGLKSLERKKYIDIVYFKCTDKDDLADYKSIIDDEFEEYCYFQTMYEVLFYKKYSFRQKDIKFIKSLAQLWNVDFNCFDIYHKNGKLYLHLKKSLILKQILTGQSLKKMKIHLWDLHEIYGEVKSEIFDTSYLEENFDFLYTSLKKKKK